MIKNFSSLSDKNKFCLESALEERERSRSIILLTADGLSRFYKKVSCIFKKWTFSLEWRDNICMGFEYFLGVVDGEY